jgi:hypothetical protein
MQSMIELLHSPFLGASSWLPVSRALREAGAACRVIDLGDAVRTTSGYYTAVAQAAADQVSSGAALAVHSAAGALVPSILERARHKPRSVVFVDALLPHPGRSWFDTAPQSMRAAIVEAANDGFAPPWWTLVAARTLERLVPDRRLRSSLEQACPRLPLAHLHEIAPPLAIPSRLPAAYLQLSPGYAAEAERAESLCWPALRLVGHHLWPLTHAGEVADALLRLTSDIN